MRVSVRAPDHLGDGVLALSAIAALRDLGEVEVHGPRWAGELYGFLGVSVVPAEAPPSGALGVLLKPSFGAAWRWRHLPRRVGLATAGRGPLLTEALADPGLHRRDGYRRVAEHLGARVAPVAYTPRGVRPPLPDRYVGLNPWSPSPTVRWPGFPALAARLAPRTPVAWFCGPGEGAHVRALGGPVHEGLSLPDFAAALEGCTTFVSNDSGAAHFAAACGARVLVVHGSTTAARTGTGDAIEGQAWCRPCYRKWCPFALRCLTSIAPDDVAARVPG